MPSVMPHRMAAQIEGDFVVFLIGMRINKPWKLHKWLPVFLGMPRMLKELRATAVGHRESSARPDRCGRIAASHRTNKREDVCLRVLVSSRL